MAPEMFLAPSYGYKVDMFSLGSVFYQLMTGEYLFDGSTAKEIMQRNVDCNLAHAVRHFKHMSSHCVDLLISMLEADPKDRPTPQKALAHAWFKCDHAILKDLVTYNAIVCGQAKTSRCSPNGPKVSAFLKSFVFGNNFQSREEHKDGDSSCSNQGDLSIKMVHRDFSKTAEPKLLNIG
jgi:serine/threonine protein kinase